MARKPSTGIDGRLNIPVLGTITLPVRLMSYSAPANEPGDKRYDSGFAFFWGADAISDVTSDDDKHKLGMIGGTMGGHTQCSMDIPNAEDKNHEHIMTIIDVRDVWEAINVLIRQPEARAKLDAACAQYPIDQAALWKKRDEEKEQAAALAKKKEEDALAAELAQLEADEAKLDKKLGDPDGK